MILFKEKLYLMIYIFLIIISKKMFNGFITHYKYKSNEKVGQVNPYSVSEEVTDF